jgi:hypothetical protein
MGNISVRKNKSLYKRKSDLFLMESSDEPSTDSSQKRSDVNVVEEGLLDAESVPKVSKGSSFVDNYRRIQNDRPLTDNDIKEKLLRNSINIVQSAADADSKENVPDHLIEEILRGNCVAFVGAGFSAAADLPGWGTLLERCVLKVLNMELVEKSLADYLISELYGAMKGGNAAGK